MTIYSSSNNLKIDKNIEVQLLNSSSIATVKDDDIVISTGTIRDDLIVRNLVDKKKMPFIVTFTTESKVSNFLENLTLVINQEITTITKKILDEIIGIKKAIESFKSYSKLVIERDSELEKLQMLALYQQIQLFTTYGKNRYRDDTREATEAPIREVYFDIKTNNKHKVTYLILRNNTSFRVLKIEQEINALEQEFLENIIKNRLFEKLMNGEKVELENRRFSFKYVDITQHYKKEFLLFGMNNKEDFSSYKKFNLNKLELFQNMALYNIAKDVKNIDEQGVLALSSLQSIFNISNETGVSFKNLDIFIFSTHSFKSVISQIPFDEQESFKRTIYSDMFEKIYNSISYNEAIKKKGLSQLRFALTLLFDKEFESLELRTKSHIFYDIINGININSQVLVNAGVDINKNESQKKRFQNEVKESLQKDEVITFLEQIDGKKFIKVFLNSLLNMQSHTQLNVVNTLQFIAYCSYIASTDDVKISYKNGFEKIQIPYCYMTFMEFQIQANKNELFLNFEDFINLENHNIKIEAFFQKLEPYECKEEKEEVTIKSWGIPFSLTKVSLRQKNSRFFKDLLIVGLFYKLISNQENIDDIIAVSLQKIKQGSINIENLCKELITPKFLTIFFKGHSKKDCNVKLKSFLRENISIFK